MLAVGYSFHFHLLVYYQCFRLRVSDTSEIVKLKTWFIFKVVRCVNCFDFTHLKCSCCWCRGWRSEGVSDLQWWESGLFSPWQNIFLCNWQKVGKGGLANARRHISYPSVLGLLVSSTFKMAEAGAPLLLAGCSVRPSSLLFLHTASYLITDWPFSLLANVEP